MPDERLFEQVAVYHLSSMNRPYQLPPAKHAQPRLPDLVEEPVDLEELVESRPPRDAVDALSRDPGCAL